jgi:NADPH2:quinone reductase
MRAIVVTRRGGPEVLELRDEPDPHPGPGQLLVDVEAVGVNFRDIYEREGVGGYASVPPFVAGAEGAGTVAAVGDGVHEFTIGDRVAWSAAPGSYAERVVVDEAKAVPVPDGVSAEVAAAALLQGMTAHYLAIDTYPVQSGDPVLVHAAAGGVGLLLTQIVKLRGGRVIATTSTPEKAELARGAGADHVIGYDDFADEARELAGRAGVAVVYDGIGQATFDQSLRAQRPRRAARWRRSSRSACTRAARSTSPVPASRTTPPPATSYCPAPPRCSAGSPTAASTSGSARAARWRRPAGRRRTSRRARRPGS